MENNKAQQVIDPLFLKPENEILQNYINGELSKNNFDIKKESLSHLEKKKMTATLISAPINLILIIVFQVFHYSKFGLLLLIVLNFILWKKFTKADLSTFFIKEIKSRPDEKFSDVIAPQLYDRCKNARLLRALIYCGFTFLIPAVLFFKPHVFYEDYQNEKYVRFYTEGLTGGESLVIPDEVDGKKVVGLRGDVFNSTSLISVTLPDAIDTIRGHAFEDCENLERINLPANLKYIGGYAFANCTKLGKIVFPKNLKFIGGYAFSWCKNMTAGRLPDEMDSIGGYAFEFCKSLTRINIPQNLSEIRGGCFSETGLVEVEIPASVTRIGGDAFYNCDKLQKLTFAEQSNLQRIGGHAFQCTQLTEVWIPPSVTEIGSSAFRDCRYLSKAYVPENCMMNERAFKNSPTTITKY